MNIVSTDSERWSCSATVTIDIGEDLQHLHGYIEQFVADQGGPYAEASCYAWEILDIAVLQNTLEISLFIQALDLR